MVDSIVGTAPGKVILLGEHAVVYGQPAIAVPIHKVKAHVQVESAPPGSGLTLIAADLGQSVLLVDAPEDDPLAAMVRLVLVYLNAAPPDIELIIRSTIPIASGMGSGTAVSTAIVRALAGHLGKALEASTVSALVFEVEKLHHGTPSGIDNTVIAYGKPVYFIRDQLIEVFNVGAPLHLLIGDTGVASPTRIAVGDVRAGWRREPARYEGVFAQIGKVAREARTLIESGRSMTRLGKLMDLNNQLLRELGVSNPELETLVAAARDAGALGAKLSGAGRGGNMIALAAPGAEKNIAAALRQAGAVQVIDTVVSTSFTDHAR